MTNLSLPITIDTDRITSLMESYPLYILLNDSYFQHWYYSKFIMPVSTIWNDSSSDFNLIDLCGATNSYIPGQLSKGFDIKYYAPHSFSSFQSFLEEIYISLSQTYYWIIFVDEYFISTGSLYHKKHFMHEYLIYGIDFLEKTFKAIGFNSKKQMDYLQIPFDELYNGITNFNESARNDLPMQHTQFIVLHNNHVLSSAEINIKELDSQISYYLSGQYPKEAIIAASSLYTDTLFYGINTYDTLLYHLGNVTIGGEPSNFRFIHAFYEHKKGILKRLEHLECLSIHKNIIQMYKEYVIFPIQTLRMKYLKNLHSSKSFYNIEDVKQKISTIKHNETRILTFVREILKNFI